MASAKSGGTHPPGFDTYAKKYLSEARAVVSDDYLLEGVSRIADAFLKARSNDRVIYFIGNGGSSSTAAHFVVDISKCSIHGDKRRFKCFALSDNVPSVTAWANDADYTKIFSEQLVGLGQKGDVLVAISGSGNSPNVLNAVEVARKLRMTTIGLTGIGGGKLKGMVDIPLIVPSDSMQHTEDVHLIICHLLTAYLRDAAPQ